MDPKHGYFLLGESFFSLRGGSSRTSSRGLRRGGSVEEALDSRESPRKGSEGGFEEGLQRGTSWESPETISPKTQELAGLAGPCKVFGCFYIKISWFS